MILCERDAQQKHIVIRNSGLVAVDNTLTYIIKYYDEILYRNTADV